MSPLRAIINQTLNTGINSDKLKIAKVIPLLKKDDKTKTDNYRSISLLALNLENIRESCIQPVVQIFYTNKFVLWQSIRFWNKTVELVDRTLQSTDNKELPLAIYMDLSKAFDGLESSIISNATLASMATLATMASERNHFSVSSVIISKKQVRWSKWYTIFKKVILTGVPQRSILGPVLFLTYVEWHYVSIRILFFHSVCWWYHVIQYNAIFSSSIAKWAQCFNQWGTLQS